MVGDYTGRYRRRSSDDSSNSSDDASSLEGETTSSMYSPAKEPIETEWTNEKHSLYLKSMEASFIDQLYTSLGMVENKKNVPESKRIVTKQSQEQFKVLHDGFWQKVSVKQPEHRINQRRGGGSHEFLRSPWIKHYKPLLKTHIPVTDEGSSKFENSVVKSNGKTGMIICSSGCSHSRDREQLSTREEVSDQNFVDEVTKGENISSKKMKTVLSGSSSSTDQVVPLRKTPAT